MEQALHSRSRMEKKRTIKSKDLPASAGMLEATRAELNSKITSVQLSVSALEQNMDAKFNASSGALEAVSSDLNSKITAVEYSVAALEKNMDAKWAELSSKITSVQLSVSALEQNMDGKLNRMLFLLEDQRNDNKASREQFISFDVRLDKAEQEIKEIKNHFDI